jgi:hypothetical protein
VLIDESEEAVKVARERLSAIGDAPADSRDRKSEPITRPVTASTVPKATEALF